MMFTGLHHVAIICSDYERSKRFYMEALGCLVIAETYRKARNSWKTDLVIPGASIQLELFSFHSPPKRLTEPEASGLRHLALATTALDSVRRHLEKMNVACEIVRVDENTGQRFFFFKDPDGLPIEIVET